MQRGLMMLAFIKAAIMLVVLVVAFVGFTLHVLRQGTDDQTSSDWVSAAILAVASGFVMPVLAIGTGTSSVRGRSLTLEEWRGIASVAAIVFLFCAGAV